MNTTTTTREDLARIMRAAHQMARRVHRPGDCYSVTFSAALRIAWREDGKTAAEIWNGYTGEEQLAALEAMTWHEYQRRESRVTRDGKPLPNYFVWVNEADPAADLEDVRQAAYLHLIRKLEDPRNDGKPLSVLLSSAVRNAAKNVRDETRRNPRPLKYGPQDEDGTRAAYIIDNAAPLADPIEADPYTYTVNRDRIRAAAADETDLAIMKLLVLKWTQERIAAALGLTRSNVAQRIKRFRDRDAARPADNA